MSLFVTDYMPIANFTGNEEPIVVFFDLETSGFNAKAEILQIGAIHENSKFSVYVAPTKKIMAQASDVHHLMVRDKKLCKIVYEPDVNGGRKQSVIEVDAFSAKVAIIKFYNFLYHFEKKIILVAHNLPFDCPRILNLMEKKYAQSFSINSCRIF